MWPVPLWMSLPPLMFVGRRSSRLVPPSWWWCWSGCLPKLNLSCLACLCRALECRQWRHRALLQNRRRSIGRRQEAGRLPRSRRLCAHACPEAWRPNTGLRSRRESPTRGLETRRANRTATDVDPPPTVDSRRIQLRGRPAGQRPAWVARAEAEVVCLVVRSAGTTSRQSPATSLGLATYPTSSPLFRRNV